MCAAAASSGIKVIQPNIDYSQYGQPTYLRRFIPHDVPRWVVDAGAHDGIDGSNSRGFVLDGWIAVLIEPLPAVFELLAANCAGHTNVRLCEAACGESNGLGTLYIGLDGPAGQSSSLCAEDTFSHNHSGVKLQVSVRRLTSILEEQNCPPRFAVLLVDAEGMDYEVLRGLDFDRFRPAVICTESYVMNPEKEQRKHALLESAGYRKQGALGSDTFWTDCEITLPSQSLALPFQSVALSADVAAAAALGQALAFFDKPLVMEDQLVFSGWAAAPDHSVPRLVLVGIERDGAFEYVQSARHPRSDVAAHFHTSEMLFTGFTAAFPRQGISDPVRCHVVQVSDAGRYDNRVATAVYY